MKYVPMFVLLAAAAARAEELEPLRYRFTVGEKWSWSAHMHSETVIRRGANVERFEWTRSGTQAVLLCAAENGKFLLALETYHGAAKPTDYVVNGQNRLRADMEKLKKMLPEPSSDVSFLWQDDRGKGSPLPRDPSLEDAILRAMDEIEVLPEGTETAWERSGTVGPVSWKAQFERRSSIVTMTMTLSAADASGARVAFEPAKAKLTFGTGHPRGFEGSVAWTIVTAEGTERRELRYTLVSGNIEASAGADTADAAADAAPMIAAQEAWRDGERDRAVELWEKAAADAGNRWSSQAKSRASEARREWPMLGAKAPALKATSWIGAAPEAGKWELVYFWATWAPRCERELSGLAEILKGRAKVAGAAVTRIDAMQTEDAVRKAAAGLPFGVALEDGEATRGFKVQDLPRVFLVDPDGRVRFEGRGNEVETLKALLDRLAAE